MEVSVAATARGAAAFAELLESGSGQPGFAEPWQAELYACTHALCRRGLFGWKTWAEVFSAEIAAHPQHMGEGVEQAYYRQWLAALETLLARVTVCGPDDIGALAERWRQAYLHTPHGQPVELENAAGHCAPAAAHPRRKAPVAVSPAAQAAAKGPEHE